MERKNHDVSYGIEAGGSFVALLLMSKEILDLKTLEELLTEGHSAMSETKISKPDAVRSSTLLWSGRLMACYA
jgi:hypothetical protein